METTDDERWNKIAEKNEEWLLPMKEDVADWLNRTLRIKSLNAGNLMDILDNGAILCRLAKKICEQAARMKSILRVIPPFDYKFWENAQSRSFFARDNAANFLRWCRQLGVNEAVLFESESLVLHTQPRLVILCLLELGRVASTCGIDPPGLIKLEKEIDDRIAEETKLTIGNHKVGTSIRRGTPSPRGRLSRASSDFRYDRPSTSCPSIATVDNPLMKLHTKVLKFTQMHNNHLQVKKVADGKYLIAGKIVFLRLLNDCHVMVRVGGGWDTLEHFVARHDPNHTLPSCSTVHSTPEHSTKDDLKCKTRRLRRSASSPSPSKAASISSSRNPLGLFV